MNKAKQPINAVEILNFRFCEMNTNISQRGRGIPLTVENIMPKYSPSVTNLLISSILTHE